MERPFFKLKTPIYIILANSIIFYFFKRNISCSLAPPFLFDAEAPVPLLEALLNILIFSGKCLFKLPHECSEYICCTWASFKAHSLTPNINDDSNINAIASSIIFCGFNSIFEAYNELTAKGVGYSIVSISVRTMTGHDVVKGHSSSLESSTSFSIVGSAEKTHAFGHCVAVVPGWTKGVFLDKPTGWKDDDCN